MESPRHDDLTPEQQKEVDDLNSKIDKFDWENADPREVTQMLIESVNLNQRLKQEQGGDHEA